MVICATLPSLRAFARHVAPKFIGERRSSAGNIKNRDLITFGGSGQKKKNYARFSDNLYGLEVINEAGVERGPGETRQQWDNEAVSNTDAESQKGILQTMTATASIERRGVEE